MGKFCLLPKIHKNFFNVYRGGFRVSRSPLAAYYETTESYVKDTNDFPEKIKKFGKIPEGTILVTADDVGLYLNIPHEDGLDALEKLLEEHEKKLSYRNATRTS